MKKLLSRLSLLFAVSVLLFGIDCAFAEEVAPAKKPSQFVYVLKLVPRLHDDKAWTEQDNQTIGRHFEHLKQAAATGKVVLAGRTQESGDKTFGIVIFEAESESAAKDFMNADPAVVDGVMTATAHPFAVALQRKQ